jgi:hypothetical protein
MRICGTGLQTLHRSILSLQASLVSVHGPPRLHFEPIKFQKFDLNADPDSDPAIRSNADPDPAVKNNADPDPLSWLVGTVPVVKTA